MLKILGKGKERKVFDELKIVYKRKYINERINSFINKHIIYGEQSIVTENDLKLIANDSYDAFIVGSDQVWRKIYMKGVSMESFFLDFVPSYKLKLSYAASFGVDYSEFTSEDVLKCGNAFSKLDYVSVRESSAIDLIDNVFKWKSINKVQLVLDPTMLLKVSEYKNLLNLKKKYMNKHVYSYIFDRSSEVEKIEKYLSDKYSIITTSSSDVVYSQQINGKDNRLISPKEWLETIYNADLVITDSFHCCVFSILFQVPFIIISNSDRGNSRLNCLLKMFCLKQRFFRSYEWFLQNEEKLFAKNDFNIAEDVLTQMRDASFTFLEESLISK